MLKLKLVSKPCTIFTFFFLALLQPVSALAATLSLNPQTSAVSLNVPFDVTIDIDTKGENTTATDVVLTFDPSFLEISNLTFSDPSLYPTNTKILDNTNGKIRMTSTQEDPVNSYKGAGTLATLNIKPKALGNATLTFSCETGKTNESNIFKKGTSTDIIECANLGNGVYTISQGQQLGATVTSTPQPTMPQSGNIGPTGALLIGGAALLGIGALLVLLF